MPAALQILAFIGMNYFADLTGFSAQAADQAPAPMICPSDALTSSLPSMEESAPILFANEVERLDDDDFKDDSKYFPNGHISPHEGKSQVQVIVSQKSSALSSQVAKHPRIYALCSLQI
jgi:hypothetical protein